jgi:hypothetical protein
MMRENGAVASGDDFADFRPKTRGASVLPHDAAENLLTTASHTANGLWVS